MVWHTLVQRLGGERRALAAFALGYLPLVWLGYQLKGDELQLTVLWPAAGLLMATLYLAPLRRWLPIILLQLACEYAIGLLVREPSLPGGLLLFMLANSSDAVVGALVARAAIWRASALGMRQGLQLLLAPAVGASVSATLGAAIAVYSYGAASYALQWQLWWVGNWLGSLSVAPVVVYWAFATRGPPVTLQLRNR